MPRVVRQDMKSSFATQPGASIHHSPTRHKHVWTTISFSQGLTPTNLPLQRGMATTSLSKALVLYHHRLPALQQRQLVLQRLRGVRLMVNLTVDLQLVAKLEQETQVGHRLLLRVWGVEAPVLRVLQWLEVRLRLFPTDRHQS